MDMKDISTTLKPEDFLAHADFVRGLARSLIADASRADDVVQETWIAAFRRPPSKAGSVRAWLARVVRNLVTTSYRTEGRRSRREKRAAVREAVPSTEEIFQREAIRRRVVEAVVALDEPYRSAIVLRYYEDLPPKKIALRLGLPVATVRTHVRRGLEKLRRTFDADHGGDRHAWCAALAPIAGLELLSSAAAASTGTAAAFTGVFAMSAKVKIAAVVLLVLGLSLAVWQILAESGPVDGADRMERSSELEIPLEAEERSPGERDDSFLDNRTADRDRNAGRETVAPSGFFIKGRVIDRETGAPVTAYEFRLVSAESGPDQFLMFAPPTVLETVRDAEGRFHFALPKGGAYRLGIHSSRHWSARLEKIEIPSGGSGEDLCIELDPGLTLSGRVVADDTGRPVPDAVVALAKEEGSDLRWLRLGRPERCIHAITDSDGRFRLQGASARSKTIAAVHPEFCEGKAAVEPDNSSDVEIRLPRSDYSIYGTALDNSGRPKEGVVVLMGGDEFALIRCAVTDRNGDFRLPPVPPGQVAVIAGPPPGESESSFGFFSEMKSVEVTNKDVEVRFGPRPWHITWHGTVYGFGGTPEPWSTVTLLGLPEGDAADMGEEARYYHTLTDNAGRFTLGKIFPGRYNVSVGFPDGSYVGEADMVNLVIPGTTERDIRVAPQGEDQTLGAISGVVVDGRTGVPMGRDRGIGVSAQRTLPVFKSYYGTIDGAGRFRLRNLPAGVYIVSVRGQGYPEIRKSGIVLEEGQVVDGLKIVLPPGGRLKLAVRGFTKDDLKNFQYELQRGDGPRQWHPGLVVSRGVEWENVHDLEPGSWTAFFRFNELGTVERQGEIIAGELTEIVVHKRDLFVPTVEVALVGTLLGSDRSPVAGTLLSFEGQRIPGGAGLVNAATVVTNPDGSFRVDRLRPGRWKVTAELENRKLLVSFDDLVIPPDPDDPQILNLVLPGGSVCGTLIDAGEDLPLREDGPEWWASVVDSRSNRKLSAHCGWLQGRRGPLVRLSGIPAGEYFLSVDAKGYQPFRSTPFRFSGEGEKDLGMIRLVPSGRLLIVVEDRAGNPVEVIKPFCNGKSLIGHVCSPLGPGRFRYVGLPLGRVKIEVDASGFEPAAKTVTIDHGRVVEVLFVLGRE